MPQPVKIYTAMVFVPEFTGTVKELAQATVPDVPGSVFTTYNAVLWYDRYWWPSGLCRSMDRCGYYVCWTLFGFAGGGGAPGNTVQPFKPYSQLVYTPEQVAAEYQANQPNNVPQAVLDAYTAASVGQDYWTFGGASEAVSRQGSVMSWVYTP